jgi:hypothetical protein
MRKNLEHDLPGLGPKLRWRVVESADHRFELVFYDSEFMLAKVHDWYAYVGTRYCIVAADASNPFSVQVNDGAPEF